MVVEENLKERQKEALKAKTIIEEEVLKFKKWLSELDYYPTLRSLSEKAEKIRQKELAKTLKKLKHLSDEEKEAIDILTRSLVQKILYYPINFIKKGYHAEGKYAISIIREIFELDEPEKPEFVKEEEEEKKIYYQ